MSNEKENWKEEVLNSLHGLKRAKPAPFLFTRLEARLEKSLHTITVRQVQWATVALVFLLVLNTYVIVRSNQSMQNSTAQEYSLTRFNAY